MPADHHMHLEPDEHTGPCPYTLERIAMYVEAARREGVDEIGITEHCHRFREFRAIMEDLVYGRPQHPAVARWLGGDFREPLHRYVEAVQKAREAGLPVRLSLEVDYLPDRVEAIRSVLRGVPWDYLLGSVHFVDGQSIDFSPDVTWPEADVEAIWRRYFELLAEAAGSGLFDVVGHIDLPKKFGHRPHGFPWEPFRAFLQAARRAGVVVEINTAGWRRPAAEMYPAPQLLAEVVAAGLDVQLGSDAHDPSQVAYQFDRALAQARAAGVRRLVRWSGRVRRYEEL